MARVGPIDGTRGFAVELWDSLADGGHWGIPRCGLLYRKDALNNTMRLVLRAPWIEGLSISPEELVEAQDEDHQGITDMFAMIAIEVVDNTPGTRRAG